jgi:hypothetical protein
LTSSLTRRTIISLILPVLIAFHPGIHLSTGIIRKFIIGLNACGIRNNYGPEIMNIIRKVFSKSECPANTGERFDLPEMNLSTCDHSSGINSDCHPFRTGSPTNSVLILHSNPPLKIFYIPVLSQFINNNSEFCSR